MIAAWRNAADPYRSQSEIVLVQENNRHVLTPSLPRCGWMHALLSHKRAALTMDPRPFP